MLLHYREQHQIISIKEKEVFHIEERKCFVFLLSILSIVWFHDTLNHFQK